MRREKIVGLLAITATFLFAGCSGSVEIGPVPTITPRPTVTPAPTPTPVVVEVETSSSENTQESVYDTKQFMAYYEKTKELPQLKVAYEGVFAVGIEVIQVDVTDSKRSEIIKSQFNSISVKEDLSPEVLMDYEATVASGDLTRIALDFSGADVILKFAQENNIPVRGPKLITNETPAWAFTKSFSESEYEVTKDSLGNETTTIEYASPEVIQARMENYIKDVMEYCNTNYPGLVVSWDVLDDVLNFTDRNPLCYRTSSFWYQALGEDYMPLACKYARQYAASDQKLFWSQDALDETSTLKAGITFINLLKADNLIDGVAIQAHYTPAGPSAFNMEEMFKQLSETGLEVQVTEFYADTNQGDSGDLEKTKDELLARGTKKYKNTMSTFKNMDGKSYDITAVFLEGLTDDTSSLNEPKEYTDVASGELILGVYSYSYPYLFDEEVNPKDAFFAALGDKSIKGY